MAGADCQMEGVKKKAPHRVGDEARDSTNPNLCGFLRRRQHDGGFAGKDAEDEGLL